MNRRMATWTVAALLAAAGVVSATARGPVDAARSVLLDPRGPAEPEPTWDELGRAFEGAKCDTRPSKDVRMSFQFATELKEIMVAGGARVKKGEEVARSRDEVIEPGLELQRERAGSLLEIRSAEATRDLAKFNFEQAEEAVRKGNALSPVEREQRRIELMQAEIQLEQAQVNHRLENIRLKQAEGEFTRYRLTAPFDGIIDEVLVSEGQGVDPTQPVMRLVNTDLLWLDPYPPTDLTLKLGLHEGSPAWVLLRLGDSPRLVRGVVKNVSPVADSVSQTRRVRVEFVNEHGWPAGTQAVVRFTEPSEEWNRFVQPSGAGAPRMSMAEGAAAGDEPEGRR